MDGAAGVLDLPEALEPLVDYYRPSVGHRLRVWATDMRWRFEGEIAGMGSASGLRVVVGRWPVSPFGEFADVMVEQADGHRVLLAPSAQVADFVGSTYDFDEVLRTPVLVQAGRHAWLVETDQLELGFVVDGRTRLGRALRVVPPRVSRAAWYAAAVDPVARLAVRGVRTRGTAGDGRREWYGARDLRRIESMRGRWHGREIGALSAVDPPVRFGFGSTPSAPSVVSLTATVELG